MPPIWPGAAQRRVAYDLTQSGGYRARSRQSQDLVPQTAPAT
jgi:hypothetical protein